MTRSIWAEGRGRQECFPLNRHACHLAARWVLLLAWHGLAMGSLSAQGVPAASEARAIQGLEQQLQQQSASELAERAQMTHQSMSELVAHLEQRGYVERCPDPRDARAKVVRFTARGHELSRTAAGCMEEIEARWTRTIGARRMQALRAALADVLAADPAPPAPAPPTTKRR